MKNILILALLIVGACVETEMPVASDGAMLFAENCAACHGAGGRGDGPWAKGLDPAPADLTRLSARGFDRARILSAVDGYQRTGAPDQQMPEFGALLEGDTVPLDVGDGRLTPVPRSLAALVLYIEAIQEE